MWQWVYMLTYHMITRPTFLPSWRETGKEFVENSSPVFLTDREESRASLQDDADHSTCLL